MRIRIKVKDLTLGQWDYIQTNVPVNHQFGPGDVRACVEFELDAELNALHVELPMAELTGLLTVLHGMEVQATAQAVLTPDALPDYLEAVRNAADPVRAGWDQEGQELPPLPPRWSAPLSGPAESQS